MWPGISLRVASPDEHTAQARAVRERPTPPPRRATGRRTTHGKCGDRTSFGQPNEYDGRGQPLPERTCAVGSHRIGRIMSRPGVHKPKIIFFWQYDSQRRVRLPRPGYLGERLSDGSGSTMCCGGSPRKYDETLALDMIRAGRVERVIRRF